MEKEIEKSRINEAEFNLLSVMLQYPNKHALIFESCSPEFFKDRINKLIFHTASILYANGSEIDNVTIFEKIKSEASKTLTKDAGERLVECLTASTATTALTKKYCEILYQGHINYLVENAKTEKDFEAIEAYRNMYSMSDVKIKQISSGIEEFDKLYENHKKNRITTGYDCLDEALGSFCGGDYIALGACTGAGKALPLDTPILTPSGWKKNKDIKVGDYVVAKDGSPTKVLGVYKQGETENYVLTLKDGRSAVCCKDHLWTVYSCRWKGYKTVSTLELKRIIEQDSYRCRVSLPAFTGENFGKHKNFIIHPYILGVLLGDGCLTGGLRYCKPSKDVYNKVKDRLPEKVNISWGKDNMTVSLTNWVEALNYLRENNLTTQSYNKYIPEEYLLASKKQRKELFDGLIDTDGYSRNGFIEYSTTSERLADNVRQLAFSLGYNCRIVERMGQYKNNGVTIKTRKNYRLYISNHNPLTIVSIEKTEPCETQCIKVDNPEELYVIKDYLVTHNTSIALNLSRMICLQGGKVLFCSLEMPIEQLRNRFNCINTGLDARKYRTCGFTAEELEKYKLGLSELDQWSLYILCDYNLTVEKLKAYATEQKKNFGLDFIVIDYLGLLSGYGNKSSYERVSALSRNIKVMATELNVPVLVLVQLNRDSKSRENKRPVLTDIRESGAIEQDADFVLFAYRDYMFSGDYSKKDDLEIIVAKNRHGISNVTCFLDFNLNTQEIRNKTNYRNNKLDWINK